MTGLDESSPEYQKLLARIEAFAVANAAKYGGTANVGSVVGSAIATVTTEFPVFKEQLLEVRETAKFVTIHWNALPEETRQAQIAAAPVVQTEKKVKVRELPQLPNAVEGAVVTRLPPEPSKYNHLGHAMSFLVNAHYARLYHGKLILRFEDTNPEKESQEFVDAMLEDCIDYLGLAPDEVRYVSDDMELLEKYATRLIELGQAYMCFCPREQMGKFREEMKECECRSKDEHHHAAEWKKFQHGAYVKGEGVLRLKGDMSSQNTVMRDPVLYRAIATEHFRQKNKYKIWPLYDFYNPIEDSLCGITHILRSNEFELRVEVHQRIKKLLDLQDQTVVHYGRINITGATTQGREIRELIETGNYIGWDDPRLVTLKALRRRGIKREAYYELVKQLGLSPYPVSLDFTMLAAANRTLVEHANRYSFVAEPSQVHVSGAQRKEVVLDSHPDRKGGRPITVAEEVFISAEDEVRTHGVKTRLMGLCTIAHDGGCNGEYRLLTYEQVKKGESNAHDIIVNWVSAEPGQFVKVEVMMDNAQVVSGYAEANVAHAKVDEVIQFERFGFCRLDAIQRDEDGKPEVYKFWFTHK